jgi:hypothetical protein
MLEAYKTAVRKTKNGRPIRTQKDMANIDCPYPYEPTSSPKHRKKGVITDEDIEKIRKKLNAPLFGKDFKPLRREEIYDR